MSEEVPRHEQISEHFQAWELYTHARHGFAARPITRKILAKYEHTLEFAERLRGFMNFVIYQRSGIWMDLGLECISGYRHLEYNRKCKSSNTSMHTDENPKSNNLGPCAMDLAPIYKKGKGRYCYGFIYDEFHEMAELVDKSFGDERPYRLGYYGKSGFVHVDCGYGYGGRRWIGN